MLIFKRLRILNVYNLHDLSIHTFLLDMFKGNTKFWYGVVNLVQMNILEAYAILQYSLIVVAVEIDSKVMKL